MIYREDLRRLVSLAEDCPTLPSYGRYNHPSWFRKVSLW
jgi:hypothetical protein